MSTRRRTTTPRATQTGFRQAIGYGQEPGTAYMIAEVDDGAKLSLSTPSGDMALTLDAVGLMDMAKNLADMFGHVLVNPTVERDKLVEIVDGVLAANGSRCLDDEVDRTVVARDLMVALTAWTKSLSRRRS